MNARVLLGALVALLVPALARAAAADTCPDVAPAPDAATDVAIRARLLLALCRDNTLAAAGFSFVAGILTSLSPCVYPLIPITVSIFGAREARTRTHAFLLSALYVAGMCALYTVLGVTFALLGLVSGGMMAMPAVVMGIGLLCFAMAASMFGAFELALPASLQERVSRVGGAGYRGAFLMGLVAGVIAAPCTGPVLAVILGLIGRTGQPGKGALLMAFYSLGMGLLFLVLGTFSSVLGRIPRSGRWMEVVKGILGLAMMATGLWLVKPHVQPVADAISNLGAMPNALELGAVMLLLDVVTGGLHLSFKDVTPVERGRKGVGLAMLLVGIMVITGWVDGAMAPRAQAMEIIRDHDEALRLGRERGRPVMVDFGADWCAACRELENVTYADPHVVAEARRFVVAIIDSTEMTDTVTELWKRYGITGLPAVVFVDSRGRVMENPRVDGFLPPADFLREMRKVH